MVPPRHAIYKKTTGTKCEVCPTEIHVGDEYVPKTWGARRKKTMIYCVPCAIVKNILVVDEGM